MLDVIINVLAIIGIIIAGGFIVFFLGDLLLSVLDPARDQEKLDKRNEKEINRLKKKIQAKESELNPQTYAEYKKFQDEVREVNKEPVVTEAPVETVTPYIIAEQPKVEPIKEQIVEPIAEINEEKPKDVDEDKALEEEALINPETIRQKEETEARLKAMEERRAAIFAEMEKFNKQEQEEAEELNLDDVTFDDLDDEIIEEAKDEDKELDFDSFDQEIEEVETQPIIEEVAPIKEEVEDLSEEEIKEAKEEIENLRRELELERQKYEMLVRETEDIKRRAVEEAKENQIANPALSLEEYEAKLNSLTERLKANEKELKACKKEFIPLMRVKKNLENDKKKLRRREALVAKQKVVLYGVNNYADIDEDKAKKLAEDLDLLDGLKLSVQHCEEVMKNNSERYPILETTYRILTEDNETIKSDIDEVQAVIDRIKKETQEN